MPSGTTVGGASSSVNDMVVPHPLPKSMVEMSGGVCPVSHQRLPTSMMQKRTYATQSTLAKASMVSLNPSAAASVPAPATLEAPPYQRRTPGSGLGRLPEPPKTTDPGFDFERFYHEELKQKHDGNTYRYFNNVNRLAQRAPMGLSLIHI